MSPRDHERRRGLAKFVELAVARAGRTLGRRPHPDRRPGVMATRPAAPLDIAILARLLLRRGEQQHPLKTLDLAA